MYLTRSIELSLKKALNQFPVCLITGPRQAGKSTLLQNYLSSYNYASLDDPFTADLANKDPKLFLSTYKAPLIIDEIQYAPELLRYIKIQVDQNRHQYGQYVLTGSQVFSLMKGVSESLAGRVAVFHLYPMNWEELEKGQVRDSKDDQALPKYIIEGFYPEFFIHSQLDKQLWFSSYLTTYVERDVRNIKAISDISRFQTFIRLLAARAGQLLNISEVAKECGITQPTAKSWLSILESTYLIYLLRPFYNNLTKRLVKSPKVYFIDTGLLCYLTGITSPEQFIRSPNRGNVFENMVIMEYLKRLSLKSEFKDFFFYRTASGIEVDLVIQKGVEISAFEIKFAKTLSPKMADSLALFKEHYPESKTAILSLNQEKMPLKRGIFSYHWSNGLNLYKEES